MLARASSDAGARLRRSKSTSTVPRPPSIAEPLDPDVAQRHALAAATVAFARVKVHDSTNDRKNKRSSELSRSKSNASRKSLTSQASHFPPRESSSRSMQPQKTSQPAFTHRQSRALTVSSDRGSAFYATPGSDHTVSAPRPLSAQASVSFSDHSRPGSQPRTNRLSASSSIASQQIRKARSMYYASSIQTGSPIARPPAKYLTTPIPVDVDKLKDSITPILPTKSIGPSPLNNARLPVRIARDETVDKARDKYMQDFQQRSVKHKPSLFLAPFKKRQDKAKEKTRRASAGLPSVASISQQTLNPSSTISSIGNAQFLLGKKEKRSFSGSLRHRFKKVFRRTSNRSSANLPVQQIEASRDYFSTTDVEPTATVDTHVIPSPDEELVQRIRSRTPSLENGRPALMRSASRSSSNGSTKSNRSNRSNPSQAKSANPVASRATSWGTSSSGDTLTQRAIKRLTVIHEAKDSVGSEADCLASLALKRKPIPAPTLAAFRDPMRMENVAEDAATPIDPKRVFSALMKEINSSSQPTLSEDTTERTPGAESDVFESSRTKTLHSEIKDLRPSASADLRSNRGSESQQSMQRSSSAAAQNRTSSIRSLGRAIRSSIRTVPRMDHRSSPGSEKMADSPATKHQARRSTEVGSSPVEGTLKKLAAHELMSAEELDAVMRQIQDDDDQAPVYTPSAEQIEKRVERAKERWKSPLETTEKLHFPRETDRIYEVTNFMKQFTANDSPNTLSTQVTEVRTSHQSTGTHPQDFPSPATHLTSPDPRRLMSPLSPSIYSRNTDGISVFPNDSVMTFGTPNQAALANDGGSALISKSQSVRSYVVGTPSPRRPESTRSSRDWKAWLSSEVSELEFTSQEDLSIHTSYVPILNDHRRNDARTSHTENDDTTVIMHDFSEISTSQADLALLNPSNAFGSVVSDNVQENGVEDDPIVSEFHDSKPMQPSASTCASEMIVEQTPTYETITRARNSTVRPGSASMTSRRKTMTTPSYSSSVSQPLLDSPISERMNDRFPFLKTGRRSSSHSTKRSCQSRSTAGSIASSSKSRKATPSPKVYSDLSVPASNKTSQRVPNTVLKRSDTQIDSKENITPPTMRESKKPATASFGIKLPETSLQILTSAAINRNTLNTSHYTTNAYEIKHVKHNSSPAATPARPRVRASLRPISPDKLSRRPKSAFDLRTAEASLRPFPINLASSSRLSTDTCKPTLAAKSSASSFALSKEPAPGSEERVIDSVIKGTEHAENTTPGQRMADRFLRERKSTPVLEGRSRGGLKLVREDTPAFL